MFRSELSESLSKNSVSLEPCAFVGSAHECTVSVALRIRVLGRDTTSSPLPFFYLHFFIIVLDEKSLDFFVIFSFKIVD
ncbi:hypothetical protein SLEP1_g26392 [Rubroshorea leprosula]|uniref:Uncharacterized protein n=1 Tax=Rubroshorea leprosula TaxID=152421 RepID=A0AAV5JVI7_9ROSI|nr:hypothetical protein SLEP1_g26392 [Rubroshorea leprosula]